MPEEAVRESGERIMGSETCITTIEKECRRGQRQDPHEKWSVFSMIPAFFVPAYSRRGLGCSVCLRSFVVTNYSYMNVRLFQATWCSRRTADRLAGQPTDRPAVPRWNAPFYRPLLTPQANREWRARNKNPLERGYEMISMRHHDIGHILRQSAAPVRKTGQAIPAPAPTHFSEAA